VKAGGKQSSSGFLVIFITTAVWTSNPTFCYRIYLLKTSTRQTLCNFYQQLSVTKASVHPAAHSLMHLFSSTDLATGGRVRNSNSGLHFFGKWTRTSHSQTPVCYTSRRWGVRRMCVNLHPSRGQLRHTNHIYHPNFFVKIIKKLFSLN
jgi:hypothetical protein